MNDKDPNVFDAKGAEIAPAELVGPAPPPATPPETTMTRRQKFRLVGLVILKRARFIAILAAVGVFIGYWDTVKNYWDKYTRPRSAVARQLDPDQEFYCPMDPQVVRSTFEPNGEVPKCPICGMPLSVRQKGEKAELPEGITGRVQFTPERVQLAGIKTVPVEYRPMVRETKTVGYVTFDESRLSRVVSRVEGYVEKLYVDKTFAVVQKGEPLAEIYSPELYSTAQELLNATRRTTAKDLAESARKRLKLLGVGDEEIDAIVHSGEATPRVVIRSPQSGYVIDKKIVVGSSVDARMTLLEVADLSTVWIEADVYEKDIAFVQPGQKVVASVEAFPNATFSGKVALIYPRLDEATRTNRVRFVFDNPRHELRPGMFAAVRIETPLESIEPYKSLARFAVQPEAGPTIALTGYTKETQPAPAEFLVVPKRAVVDTGRKKVVYVEREAGLFEGVEVELGPPSGDFYPVVKGLKPGDKVAAAGGFLIDAETRLNPAAASTYFGASGGPQSGGHSGTPSTPSQRPAAGEKGTVPGESKGGQSPFPPGRVAVATPTPEQRQNIDKLPAGDREAALRQRACPVTRLALGSMGVPVKITLRGQTVFLCCQGCAGKAKRQPDEMLKIVAEFVAAPVENKSPASTDAAPPEPADEIQQNLAALPAEDRQTARAQRLCPVTGMPLGGMGVPYKITLDTQPVFLCCEGCRAAAEKDPAKTLKKVAELKAGQP